MFKDKIMPDVLIEFPTDSEKLADAIFGGRRCCAIPSYVIDGYEKEDGTIVPKYVLCSHCGELQAFQL